MEYLKGGESVQCHLDFGANPQFSLTLVGQLQEKPTHHTLEISPISQNGTNNQRRVPEGDEKSLDDEEVVYDNMPKKKMTPRTINVDRLREDVMQRTKDNAELHKEFFVSIHVYVGK